MTIRKILTEPDPFLRQKSEKVEFVNDEIRTLMDDMVETMYDAPGIGLAAIQIGVPKRVIVIDLAKGDEKKNPLFFPNKRIAAYKPPAPATISFSVSYSSSPPPTWITWFLFLFFFFLFY